ncbi:2620_t:CDS:1, partial [Cetraspora pellucida]
NKLNDKKLNTTNNNFKVKSKNVRNFKECKDPIMFDPIRTLRLSNKNLRKQKLNNTNTIK